jgi:hypothetical protein
LHVTRSILSHKSRLSLDSIVRQMKLACTPRYEKAETPPCEGRTLRRSPYTERITFATMSLCNVCKSIPFRKIIDRDRDAIVNDGFRFNSIGRTSPMFSDRRPWYERRCTVSELVCRAKICRLCEFVLLSIQDATWIRHDKPRNMVEPMTWEEAKTSISQNLMIWMLLIVVPYHNLGFSISLGSPREGMTRTLELDFRKSPGKSYYT